jgi:sRNA-binding protein
MSQSPTPTPSASPPRRPARPQRPRPPADPVLSRLATLHPALFGPRPRPLKRGIFEDLITRHPGEFTPEALKRALGQHVRATRYLVAVAEGQDRQDLDGHEVEPMAFEHVVHAVAEVLRRRLGREGRGPAASEAARAWARACLVRGLQQAADPAEALAQARTRDPEALALLEQARAELAGQAARREALQRAFLASGQSVEAFADMYGLDPAAVREALAAAGLTPPTSPVTSPAGNSSA